jgi:excisionase family DNA binding protein
MSSNIKVQRICKFCGKEFTAKTTITKYCSHKCSSAAYKARNRKNKVEKTNKETFQIQQQPIEKLKTKEFLTTREVAQLLNCSVRTVYYYINNGKIKAVNLGQRITRVKRSDIDNLFNQPQVKSEEPEPKQYDISECYGLPEVMDKYKVSRSTLDIVIKRNNIPKQRVWKEVFVPKELIDKIFK